MWSSLISKRKSSNLNPPPTPQEAAHLEVEMTKYYDLQRLFLMSK
jgi:hypothetical protein